MVKQDIKLLQVYINSAKKKKETKPSTDEIYLKLLEEFRDTSIPSRKCSGCGHEIAQVFDCRC